MGYPMLDPERDLEGATPETHARALLRPLRRGGVAVVRERPPDDGTKHESDRPEPDETVSRV